MIFTYRVTTHQTYIEAIPELEEEKYGFRAEAPYPKITLNNHRLIFNYPVKNIHPDLLALLCLITFYPFCKHWITFPKFISTHFNQTINQLKPYGMVQGKYVPLSQYFQVRNVDSQLKPYSGGKQKCVAYGGGIDSTAVICLFPDAIIIHEKCINQPDRTQNIMQDLSSTHQVLCIESNNKLIAKPRGWCTWASCASTSVLVATDYDIGYIMLGSSLGSVYLNNGRSYYPAHQRGYENQNQWFRLFQALNLHIFSPIAGISEIGLTKILKCHSKYIDKLIYCILKEGDNCHQCWKCLRRDLILTYVVRNYQKVNWDQYHQKKILKHLQALPNEGGPSLQHALVHSIPYLPNWLRSWGYYLTLFPLVLQTDLWITRYYQKALDLVPPEFRPKIKEQIEYYLLPLPKDQEYLIETWHPNKTITTMD